MLGLFESYFYSQIYKFISICRSGEMILNHKFLTLVDQSQFSNQITTKSTMIDLTNVQIDTNYEGVHTNRWSI